MVGLLAIIKNMVVKEEKPVEVKQEVEDPISVLRRKVLSALEYTGNYQEVLLENGKIVEVEKMERFASERVRDALYHAGFIVPPYGMAETTWGDAQFDAIGVNSKYLVLGEVKWGEEVSEEEVESLLSRAEEAEKRGRGREVILFIASLRNLQSRAREKLERCQKKNFVVSFEEVRPYSFDE